MQTIDNKARLQHILGRHWRRSRIAFVPTMGNLHEGHLQLVRRARQLADMVVVSIFVNPLQFGPGEDLDAYPRTLTADREKLFAEGVQLLYTPPVGDIYPQGMDAQTVVSVPELSDTLCGRNRPGHFDGVTTVVAKLFNIVRPNLAVFGEKDFQQLCIIRKMVEDLCMPLEVIGVPTVRAEDGLALSSRNGYLSREQRRVAPLLHRVLLDCRDAIACGFDNFLQLESHARMQLLQAGFERRTTSRFAMLAPCDTVASGTEEMAILAAARLGSTRLIDNVRLSLNPGPATGACSPAAERGLAAGGPENSARRSLRRSPSLPKTDGSAKVLIEPINAGALSPDPGHAPRNSQAVGVCMSESKVYPVPSNFATTRTSTPTQYAAHVPSLHRGSETPSLRKWPRPILTWDKPWDSVSVKPTFERGEARWFSGGRLNVSVNCIDRHLPARAATDGADLGRG